MAIRRKGLEQYYDMLPSNQEFKASKKYVESEQANVQAMQEARATKPEPVAPQEDTLLSRLKKEFIGESNPDMGLYERLKQGVYETPALKGFSVLDSLFGGNTFKTARESAVNSGTLGVKSAIESKIAPEAYAKSQKLIAENPKTALAGEALGMIVPGIGIAKGAKALGQASLVQKALEAGRATKAGQSISGQINRTPLTQDIAKALGLGTLGVAEAGVLGAGYGATKAIETNQPILESAVTKAAEFAPFGVLGAGAKYAFPIAGGAVGGYLGYQEEGEIKPEYIVGGALAGYGAYKGGSKALDALKTSREAKTLAAKEAAEERPLNQRYEELLQQARGTGQGSERPRGVVLGESGRTFTAPKSEMPPMQAQPTQPTQTLKGAKLPEQVKTVVRTSPEIKPKYTEQQTRQISELDKNIQISRQRVLQTEKDATARTEKLNTINSQYAQERSRITGEQRVMTPSGEGVVVSKATNRTQVKVGNTTKYYKDAEITPISTQGKPAEIVRKGYNVKTTPSPVEQTAVATEQAVATAEQPTVFAAQQAGKPRVVSSRKLPPNLENKTTAEFDDFYKLGEKPDTAKIQRLVDDVGAYVINRTGSDDVQEILNIYKKKYNLPENTTVRFVNNMPRGAKGSNAIAYPVRSKKTDQIIGYRIDIMSGKSKETAAGLLRHEIEHIKDLAGGYKGTKTDFAKKPELKEMTMNKAYRQEYAGHHKNYGWFEPDYLRRAVIKDALKEGRFVKKAVLDEYPDLKNVKKREPAPAPVVTEQPVASVKAEQPAVAKTNMPKESQSAKPISQAVKDEVSKIEQIKDVREAGWKLHLATDVPEEVAAKLKELGIKNFKVGRNSDQTGKDLTLYIGSKESAKKIAAILDRELGDLLKPAYGDALADDILFTNKVAGRFDVASDRGIKDGSGMNQYGAKGHGIFDDDIANINWSPASEKQKIGEAAIKRADKFLTEKYGEYYTGTATKIKTNAPVTEKPQTKQPPVSKEKIIADSTEQANADKFVVVTTPGGRKVKMYGKLDETNIPKTRAFGKNVSETPITEDQLRARLTDEPLMRGVLENKTVVKSAETKFRKEKMQDLIDDLRADRGLREDDAPLARLVANQLVRSGKVNEAYDVIAAVAEKLTIAGRGINAAKIFKDSEPAVFVKTVERLLNKINTEGVNRYGDKWKKVVLRDELRGEILKSEFIDEALMNRVYTQINRDIPVTKFEKLNAMRRTMMLLNPKTHIRNVLGNTIMAAMYKTSDTLATGIEAVVSKVAPSILPAELRTKSTLGFLDKNLRNIATEDFKVVKDYILKNAKYEIEGARTLPQMGERRIFEKGAITRGVERLTGKQFQDGIAENLVQASQKALEAGDLPFLKMAYIDSLSSYMKAQGLREVNDAARQYAIRRATEATYRQANKLSEIISQAKRKGGFIGFATEAIIPFSKTPANILYRGIEYSPLSLVNMIYKGATGSYKGNPSMIIEDLSKGLTGSGIIGLGMSMANLGLAKVEEKLKGKGYYIEQLAGEQKYSIKLPSGDSFTLDWAQPFAIPFFMGVSLQEAIHKNMDAKKALAYDKALLNSFGSGIDTLTSISLLQGVVDLFNTNKSWGEKIVDIPVSYVEQFIPTLLGQFSKSADEYKRETYDPSPLEQIKNSLISRTPIAEDVLKEKLDIFGRPIKQASAAEQFFSPGTLTKDAKDPLVNELNRLYKLTEDTIFLPRQAPRKLTDNDGNRIYLTPDQLYNFQKNMGQANYKAMNQFISSKIFKTLSDEQRAKGFEMIAKETYEIEKAKIVPDPTKEQDKAKAKKAQDTKNLKRQMTIQNIIPKEPKK